MLKETHPDNFDVMAMIAIGKRGPKENLPPQLQERKHPNDRKPLTEIVMEGQFRKINNSGCCCVISIFFSFSSLTIKESENAASTSPIFIPSDEYTAL
jgi:hypothetical protein